MIDLWSDTQIQAGADWQQEINAALQRAAVAILLISADFLASDFIIDHELPLLLSTEDVHIIPVMLTPCVLTAYPDLARLQSVNDISQPVISLDKPEQEALWSRVATIVTASLQERGIAIPSGLPHSPPDRPEPKQTQNPFTQHVRQEVGNLLKRQMLSPLRTTLLERVASTDEPVSPEDVLLPQDESFAIEASIDALHRATDTCLQRLRDHGSHTTSEIATGATDVLGWLVLLAVSETWVQEQRRGTAYRAGSPASEQGGSLERDQHFQQLLGADYIALPLETDAGTEVVEARLRRHHATFALDRDQVKVVGPNRVRPGDLELGLDYQDALTGIKQLIWNTVYKETDAPVEDGVLKSTLEIRYKRGESYYVVIPARSAGSLAGSTALLHLLRRDLPYLGAFLVGIDSGEQVLVMNEVHLMVLIGEFLRMLRSYV